MKAIVSGAGIAGLTFSLCMQRAGHDVTVIEKSPNLRDSGYMMDFFGPGYDVAEILGLLDEIEMIHYPIDRLEFVSSRGETKFMLHYESIRKEWFNGRHYNFMRGDLEKLLFDQLPNKDAVIFGKTIETVCQSSGKVSVTLSDGTDLTGDVLIGADGIHSNVRRLVFGSDDEFSLFLGFHTLSYLFHNMDHETMPLDAFYLMTEPKRQASIYPIRGGRTATFFVHRATLPPVDDSVSSARKELAREYGSMDWVVPELIKRAQSVGDIYFDGVWQIIMASWTGGRTALIGDAGYCVSLLAGQGSAVAMLGASILAGELDSAEGQVASAFRNYNERMRPYIETRQKAGRSFGSLFLPEDEGRLMVRDYIMRYSERPPMSWLVKRDLAGGRIVPEDATLISRFGRQDSELD